MNRHVMIHIFMFIIAMSPIVAKKVIHIHRIKPITAPIIMVEMPKISFLCQISKISTKKKNEPTPQNMSIGRTYSSNKTHKYIAA